MSAADVKAASSFVWGSFGGLSGYAAATAPASLGADVELGGGAAWQRLVAEVEFALLSAPLPCTTEGHGCSVAQRQSARHYGAKYRCGDDRDLGEELMFEAAYEPLHQCVRYIAARVAWALKRQQATALDWMRTAGTSRRCSSFFGHHHAALESSAALRQQLAVVADKAVFLVAAQLLESLQATLFAGCSNPCLLLCPSSAILGRSAVPSRRRVREELLMRRQHDSINWHVDGVERCFHVLRHKLAVQASTRAGTALNALCHKGFDDAMDILDD